MLSDFLVSFIPLKGCIPVFFLKSKCAYFGAGYLCFCIDFILVNPSVTVIIYSERLERTCGRNQIPGFFEIADELSYKGMSRLEAILRFDFCTFNRGVDFFKDWHLVQGRTAFTGKLVQNSLRSLMEMNYRLWLY